MIIAVDFVEYEVDSLVSVFRRYKRAIWWTISNIITIQLDICTHQIKLEEDVIPTIEHHCKLKPPMQEKVKKEIIK